MLTEVIDSMIQTKEEKQNKRVWIIKSWKDTANSSTLIFSIPKDLQKEYGLSKPTALYLIPKKGGLFLKKVDLESVE